MMGMRAEIVEYMGRCGTSGKIPNFWMSPWYLENSGWVPIQEDGAIGWIESEGSQRLMLPMLSPSGAASGKPWADFPLPSPVLDGLDRQYVYSPSQINSWTGGANRGRRKALGVALRALSNPSLSAFCLSWGSIPSIQESAAESILREWSAEKGDGVYDPEMMVQALLVPPENSMAKVGQLYLGDTLLALVMIDLGPITGDGAWWNFRYCLPLNIPGVAELARFFVWDYLAQVFSGPHNRPIFINDGGDLDRPGLAQFKQKLNPLLVLYTPTNNKME